MGAVKKFKYYWKESKTIVLSLMVTAAVLPFVIWVMVSRQQIMTWAKASPGEQLMIWFEPAELVMKVGQSTTVDVMAEYSANGKLIPAVKSKVTVSPGLSIENEKIEYNFGFTGRKKIGSVKVKVNEGGEQFLSVSENDVFTSLPDLPVVTARAKIFVK